jgi:hypothetical protein
MHESSAELVHERPPGRETPRSVGPPQRACKAKVSCLPRGTVRVTGGKRIKEVGTVMYRTGNWALWRGCRFHPFTSPSIHTLLCLMTCWQWDFSWTGTEIRLKKYIFSRENLVTTAVKLINSVEYNRCREVKVVKIYNPPPPQLALGLSPNTVFHCHGYTTLPVGRKWTQFTPTKHNAPTNVCSFPHQIFRLGFMRFFPSQIPIYYASVFASTFLR